MLHRCNQTDRRNNPKRHCQFNESVPGFLGTAYVPIKNDISGNVTKVRTKYEKGKDKFKYIEDMIEDDLLENSGKMGTATEGLLWLKRLVVSLASKEYLIFFIAHRRN